MEYSHFHKKEIIRVCVCARIHTHREKVTAVTQPMLIIHGFLEFRNAEEGMESYKHFLATPSFVCFCKSLNKRKDIFTY